MARVGDSATFTDDVHQRSLVFVMERVRWSSAPELELLEGLIGTREQVIACLQLQASFRRRKLARQLEVLAKAEACAALLVRRAVNATLESIAQSPVTPSAEAPSPGAAEALSPDAAEALAEVIGADGALSTLLGGASASPSSARVLDTATVNGVSGPFVNTWPRPVEADDDNIALKMFFFHRSDGATEINEYLSSLGRLWELRLQFRLKTPETWRPGSWKFGVYGLGPTHGPTTLAKLLISIAKGFHWVTQRVEVDVSIGDALFMRLPLGAADTLEAWTPPARPPPPAQARPAETGEPQVEDLDGAIPRVSGGGAR